MGIDLYQGLLCFFLVRRGYRPVSLPFEAVAELLTDSPRPTGRWAVGSALACAKFPGDCVV